MHFTYILAGNGARCDAIQIVSSSQKFFLDLFFQQYLKI